MNDLLVKYQKMQEHHKQALRNIVARSRELDEKTLARRIAYNEGCLGIIEQVIKDIKEVRHA